VHELVPGRAGAHGPLSYELVHPHLLLVPPFAVLPDSSTACRFHIAVNVSTSPACEASHQTSPDKLKPVVPRVLGPRRDGHPSRPLGLCIIHVSKCGSWADCRPASDTGTKAREKLEPAARGKSMSGMESGVVGSTDDRSADVAGA
jgi:hypothetical protein